MFRVVVHRKVTQELKLLKKAHLKKFSELLEASKQIQFPGKDSMLKRLKARRTLTVSELEISE